MCSNCEQNEAKWINPMEYDYGFFWCDKSICNSPRMGICGYDGSLVYPDQFKPDEE